MDRMEFLNTRIDELKAQIAKDKLAHSFGQELYNSRYGNDPRYNTAMLEYILSGDRSGIDAYAGTVQAHEQMLANQKLMQAQQQQETAYKLDEYQKNYQLAAADYDYAASELMNDPTNKQKQSAFKKATTNMNYWGDKLGYEPADGTIVATAEGPTQAQQEMITGAATEEPEWTDEAKAKAQAEAAALTDEGKKAKALTDIEKRGKTKEEKKADADAAKAKIAKEIDDAIASGNKDKLPKGHSVRSFDGVRYVCKKDGDKWVKVKKWGK